MSDRRRRIIAGAMILLCLVLTGIPAMRALLTVYPAARYTAGGQETALRAADQPEGTVAVNLAEKEELMALPGVGETLADMILAEREENGPFRYPEDLLTVPGIGEAKLAEMRPMLDLRTEEE